MSSSQRCIAKKTKVYDSALKVFCPFAFVFFPRVFPGKTSCDAATEMSRYENGVWGTLQGTNISHLGKRKIIFKMPFLGDMSVPWRVIIFGGTHKLTTITKKIAGSCYVFKMPTKKRLEIIYFINMATKGSLIGLTEIFLSKMGLLP